MTTYNYRGPYDLQPGHPTQGALNIAARLDKVTVKEAALAQQRGVTGPWSNGEVNTAFSIHVNDLVWVPAASSDILSSVCHNMGDDEDDDDDDDGTRDDDDFGAAAHPLAHMMNYGSARTAARLLPVSVAFNYLGSQLWNRIVEASGMRGERAVENFLARADELIVPVGIAQQSVFIEADTPESNKGMLAVSISGLHSIPVIGNVRPGDAIIMQVPRLNYMEENDMAPETQPQSAARLQAKAVRRHDFVRHFKKLLSQRLFTKEFTPPQTDNEIATSEDRFLSTLVQQMLLSFIAVSSVLEETGYILPFRLEDSLEQALGGGGASSIAKYAALFSIFGIHSGAAMTEQVTTLKTRAKSFDAKPNDTLRDMLLRALYPDGTPKNYQFGWQTDISKNQFVHRDTLRPDMDTPGGILLAAQLNACGATFAAEASHYHSVSRRIIAWATHGLTKTPLNPYNQVQVML